MQRFVVLSSLLLVTACGAPSIVGDWFLCADDACSGPGVGYRYSESEYETIQTDVREGWDLAGTICINPLPQLGGQYRWDPETGLMEWGKDFQFRRTVLVSPSGDRATEVFEDGVMQRLRRIDDAERVLPYCSLD